MRNSEQPLRTALAQLQSLSPETPATLAELTALSAARDCIDELLWACVAELRADPETAPSWSDIAAALGSSSAADAATRQQYSPRFDHDNATEQTLLFWKAFAALFAWDFLPTEFLHALYGQWMTQEFPDASHLPKKAFTRRLKAAATASDEWFYTRARPGSLMDAPEPLDTPSLRWSRTQSETPRYGLRRRGK